MFNGVRANAIESNGAIDSVLGDIRVIIKPDTTQAEEPKKEAMSLILIAIRKTHQPETAKHIAVIISE